MLIGAIRVFGRRRVVLVILGIVSVGFAIALGTLRGVSSRR
jgi:hypothetical protein